MRKKEYMVYIHHQDLNLISLSKLFYHQHIKKALINVKNQLNSIIIRFYAKNVKGNYLINHFFKNKSIFVTQTYVKFLH